MIVSDISFPAVLHDMTPAFRDVMSFIVSLGNCFLWLGNGNLQVMGDGGEVTEVNPFSPQKLYFCHCLSLS